MNKLSREQFNLMTRMFVTPNKLNGNEKRTMDSLRQSGLAEMAPNGICRLTYEGVNILTKGKRIHRVLEG